MRHDPVPIHAGSQARLGNGFKSSTVAVMNDSVVAVLVLLAMGTIGVAILMRARLGLSVLECVAYGEPLGVVSVSLLLLGIASVTGHLTNAVTVVATGASVLVGLAILLPELRRHRAREAAEVRVQSGGGDQTSSRSRDRSRILPGLFIAYVIYQGYVWTRLLRYEDGALVSSMGNVYGDWDMHLGDVASFLWSNNFPPEHPRLLGAAESYHYLSAFTAAAIASLGFDPAMVMR